MNYLRTKFVMSFLQLERESDDICKGERVECGEHERVRRIDGKCNNLNNKDWGATATGMRRLAPTQYGDGLHSLRKVEKIFYQI